MQRGQLIGRLVHAFSITTAVAVAEQSPTHI
jgi:hypothetical protein